VPKLNKYFSAYKAIFLQLKHPIQMPLN